MLQHNDQPYFNFTNISDHTYDMYVKNGIYIIIMRTCFQSFLFFKNIYFFFNFDILKIIRILTEMRTNKEQQQHKRTKISNQQGTVFIILENHKSIFFAKQY